MSKTRFCFSCRTFHPEEEMRLTATKNGRRWRCVKSLDASRNSSAQRDEFGKISSQANSELSASRARIGAVNSVTSRQQRHDR